VAGVDTYDPDENPGPQEEDDAFRWGESSDSSPAYGRAERENADEDGNPSAGIATASGNERRLFRSVPPVDSQADGC